MDSREAFELVNQSSASRVVFSCEHASKSLPAEAEPMLGIGGKLMSSHNAYDAGSRSLTLYCAQKLNSAAVLGKYSRLWIDLNRREEDRDLIRTNIYETVINSNFSISEQERNRRIETYHRPYFDVCRKQIEQARNLSGKEPVVISIHAFTRQLENAREPRPWDIGLLYNSDESLLNVFSGYIKHQHADFRVGYNQPYNMKNIKAGGMISCAEEKGLSNVLIEICDDLLQTSRDIELFGNIIVNALDKYKVV